MVNPDFLKVAKWEAYFLNNTGDTIFDWHCEDPAGKAWEEDDKRPICNRPYMPKGWHDDLVADNTTYGGALPGTDELCTESYSVSMGSMYTMLCVFFMVCHAICFSLLLKWYRTSRNKRKTQSNKHPPHNSTEKFYVVTIIIAIVGMLTAIDIGGSAGLTPDWMYSVYLGIQGGGVNSILVIMVMNWITVMTARGKDNSMLPWVKNLYWIGLAGSSVDLIITSMESFTHPIVGAYDGTINGMKHLFLAILEGFYCGLGLFYARKMRDQMASGGAATEQQKKSVARIIGYSRVVAICGSIGVLYRTSNFIFRLGYTMFPGPPCSAVGSIFYSTVEFVVLLVVVAVTIAQKPASSSKVGDKNNMMKTTQQSSSTSSTE